MNDVSKFEEKVKNIVGADNWYLEKLQEVGVYKLWMEVMVKKINNHKPNIINRIFAADDFNQFIRWSALVNVPEVEIKFWLDIANGDSLKENKIENKPWYKKLFGL